MFTLFLGITSFHISDLLISYQNNGI